MPNETQYGPDNGGRSLRRVRNAQGNTRQRIVLSEQQRERLVTLLWPVMRKERGMQRVLTSQESAAMMRLEMIAAGAYYWLRAEGQDENMVSALNRMKYRQMVERFDALNIPKPTPEEMYACAAEKWPSHKLHAAPKAA